MKNFAMLGKWHVHADEYARGLNALPGCRVAKVWDPDGAKAAEWAEKLGCESASFDSILVDPSIEGVAVCTATNEHCDVMLRASAAGKAIFTEKVLTARIDEAEKIRAAVLANRTRFAISFPHLCLPWNIFAFETVRSGKLGEINYARVRNAHDGATGGWLPSHFFDPVACGGGAMIDLGAHPMYLICTLLGEPVGVQSTFTKVTGKAVEDNAVSVLRFANGAIGVSETGFVSVDYPIIFEIGGRDGSLIIRGGEVSYRCPETGNVWKTVKDLPAARPTPLAQWALADKPEDIPDTFGIDAAVRLTRVMEAAYRGIV